jgi:prephenate dehydrogenase
MKVQIIGIGLIGGSFALDIKLAFPEAEIYGSDANEKNLKKAKELEIIDYLAKMEDVKHADVVLVAVPVDVAGKVVTEVLDLVEENTLVFDAGSTKSGLCKEIRGIKRPNVSTQRNF